MAPVQSTNFMALIKRIFVFDCVGMPEAKVRPWRSAPKHTQQAKERLTGVVTYMKPGDFLFVFDMVDVLALDDVSLFHGLQGEFLSLVLLQVSELHIAESTYIVHRLLVSRTYLHLESSPTRSR